MITRRGPKPAQIRLPVGIRSDITLERGCLIKALSTRNMLRLERAECSLIGPCDCHSHNQCKVLLCEDIPLPGTQADRQTSWGFFFLMAFPVCGSSATKWDQPDKHCLLQSCLGERGDAADPQ